jgi:two-component system LytT family response regulator
MGTDNITAIIVDDEIASVQTLDAMINNYCPDIHVIGKAVGSKEGFDLINTSTPSVVFLDIEMPHKSGFRLIEEFDNRNFYVVFYTAFSRYAIEAIKVGAFDYLMKPVDDDDLCSVVSRIKRAIRRAGDIKAERGKDGQRLSIRTGNDTRVIQYRQIIRVDADGSYSMIHLKGGEKIMVSKNLKKMEGLLSGRPFIRVHNSHMVNSDEVDVWRFPQNKCLLSDGSLVSLSSRRKDQIKECLSH